MKPIRFYFSIICGKMSIAVLRLLKKRATNFPGSVVLAICPQFLKYIDKPEKIIAITGTNGKTTVSNMLHDILADNGYDCTNNSFGGNVDTGISAALLKDSTLSGKAKKKYCILEIDERSAAKIYPYIEPDLLVVTNLTRDSYRRNAHVEYIFDILEGSIPDRPHLILNADDLISSSLKKDNKRTYFAMQPLEGEQPSFNIVHDITVCPLCGSPLEYDYLHYNHIGKAHCSKCSFCSPKADVEMISAVRTGNGHSSITLMNKGVRENYDVPCESIISLYNALAAITALRTFGLSEDKLRASFKKIEVVKSRYEIDEINGRTLRCIMAKGYNPIACSRSISVVKDSPDTSVVLLWDGFFDKKESSENTAWYYEVDFDVLAGDNIKQIIIAGKRAHDLHLSLLIAGVPEDKIKTTELESDAAQLLELSNTKNIYILFNMYMDSYKDTVKAKVKEMMNNADRSAIS